MKKTLFCILSIFLCIALFCTGCSRPEPKAEKERTEPNAEKEGTKGELCRVLCVMDEGFVVWIEDIGNVYIAQFTDGVKITPLGTVVMEFHESDLVSERGTFIDCFGEEQEYSYILEKPKSIRLPTENEPTFG